MKSFTSALAAIMSVATASNMFELLEADSAASTDMTSTFYKNSFGHLVEETLLEDG